MILGTLAAPERSHAIGVGVSPGLASVALGGPSVCEFKVFPFDLKKVNHFELAIEGVEVH